MSESQVSLTIDLTFHIIICMNSVVARDDIPAEIRDFVAFKNRGLLGEVKAVAHQLVDLKATPSGRARLPAWKQAKMKELADRRKVSASTKDRAIISNVMSLARRASYTVYSTKSGG